MTNFLKKLLNKPLLDVLTLPSEGGSERLWIPLPTYVNSVVYAFFVGVISGGLLALGGILLGMAYR